MNNIINGIMYYHSSSLLVFSGPSHSIRQVRLKLTVHTTFVISFTANLFLILLYLHSMSSHVHTQLNVFLLFFSKGCNHCFQFSLYIARIIGIKFCHTVRQRSFYIVH